ncbi:MAG: recombinase family protein [Bdellovibrionales bacterium]|nr:recombinase family protein [Bdellovibrionales bacterium]
MLEIARMTGVPRTSLRDILIRAGISLKVASKGNRTQGQRRSGQVRWNSPYGFKYERGRLVPHPQEFETLRLILRWSKEELSFEEVSKKLNSQKLRPRSASLWTRFTVRQIIKWHQENPEAILKRDGNVVTYAPWDPASSSESKTINEPKPTRRSRNGTR